MLPETVRISQPTKEHLLRLKRSTGIKQWNILCRWAFCTSASDGRPLTMLDPAPASNVEMTWKVFAGSHAAAYAALLRADAQRRGVDDATLGELLQAHVRRGVGGLLTTTTSINSLVSQALP